jgi:hypothetical protein
MGELGMSTIYRMSYHISESDGFKVIAEGYCPSCTEYFKVDWTTHYQFSECHHICSGCHSMLLIPSDPDKEVIVGRKYELRASIEPEPLPYPFFSYVTPPSNKGPWIQDVK